MRKLLLLTVVLALFTLLIGPALAQDKTELQVNWWGSQNRHDRTIKVIEMWEATHPDVDVVYEFAAFQDYWTLENTKAAGEQLPCVMQQDYAYLAEWSTRNLIIPLDPYYESGAIDTTNIDQSLLDGGKVGDHYYGISLGTNSQSVIIDVDAFEKAGIDLPAEDWTWADFEEISTELHDKLGIWAIHLGQSGVGNNTGIEDVQVWKAFNLGYGLPVVSADGKSIGYTDDQPTIDYFNMIRRLQEAGVVETGEEAAEFNGVPLESSPIVTQQTAMQYQWSNQVVAVYSGAGPERHFRLWPLPRPEDGQPSNYLKPSQFFSITSQCQTPELAADFINYVTNDLAANEVLFAERGVPISSAVREHLLPMLDAAGAETFDFIERITADSSPIPPPDPPNWSNFATNVYAALVINPITYGQLTPEDGVVLLREEGDAVLGG
jgi:ABC-type glycerol-3-phosphate transport system substrate-binding protein